MQHNCILYDFIVQKMYLLAVSHSRLLVAVLCSYLNLFRFSGLHLSVALRDIFSLSLFMGFQ